MDSLSVLFSLLKNTYHWALKQRDRQVPTRPGILVLPLASSSFTKNVPDPIISTNNSKWEDLSQSGHLCLSRQTDMPRDTRSPRRGKVGSFVLFQANYTNFNILHKTRSRSGANVRSSTYAVKRVGLLIRVERSG
jgi:hypothetical protein